VQPQQQQPSSSSTPLIEVMGGEIRIGEELSEFQELIKTWFYMCYCIGVIVFGMVYYVVFSIAALVGNRVCRQWGLLMDDDDIFAGQNLDEMSDMRFDDVDDDDDDSAALSQSDDAVNAADRDERTPSVPNDDEEKDDDDGDDDEEVFVEALENFDVDVAPEDSPLNQIDVNDDVNGGADKLTSRCIHNIEASAIKIVSPARRMRAVEILEEEDGDASSWENLSVAADETITTASILQTDPLAFPKETTWW